MSPDLLEDRIQAVLHGQADGVPVPPAPPLPSGAPAPRSRLDTGPRRSRGRVALLAACALVAAGLGAAGLGWIPTPGDGGTSSGPASESVEPSPSSTFRPVDGQDPVADGAEDEALVPPGDRPLVLDTGAGVRLEAASLTVEAGGRIFDPTAADGEVYADGDPGTDPTDPGGGSTTLEVTWSEDGIEMRVVAYVVSDGTDWWVDEIRTYDGAADGDWLFYEGEFFRSPLGQPYAGDIEVGGLRVADAVLLGFAPPSTACDSSRPAGELLIDPGTGPVSETDVFLNPEAGGRGFALFVTVRDAATCDPVPLDDLAVRASSSDEGLATAYWGPPVPGQLPLRVGEAWVEVAFLEPGDTSVRIEVVDEGDGPTDPADDRVLASVVVPATITEE